MKLERVKELLKDEPKNRFAETYFLPEDVFSVLFSERLDTYGLRKGEAEIPENVQKVLDELTDEDLDEIIGYFQRIRESADWVNAMQIAIEEAIPREKLERWRAILDGKEPPPPVVGRREENGDVYCRECAPKYATINSDEIRENDGDASRPCAGCGEIVMFVQ
jgi:hypothetical protein